MIISPFFDQSTATFSYIVHDPKTLDALIIDPVLDYEVLTATISYESATLLKNFVHEQKLKVRLVLDTHVHADHMTASYFLKQYFQAPSAIGCGFNKSKEYFSHFYDINCADYAPAYDYFLEDHQSLKAGSIPIKALAVPGHTPSCTAYLIEENIFGGDAIFLPTLGCGRADFPGGSAKDLYQSIQQKFYSLPEYFTIWVGHDYPSEGQAPKSSTTVKESKEQNRLIKATTTLEEFIESRDKKDRTLSPPRLLLPSLQVNILGGQLPQADREGRRFLRTPLKVKNS